MLLASMQLKRRVLEYQLVTSWKLLLKTMVRLDEIYHV